MCIASLSTPCLCFFSCLARWWFCAARDTDLSRPAVWVRVCEALSCLSQQHALLHNTTSQPTDYTHAQWRCDNWVLQLCTARYVFKIKAMRTSMDWCTSSYWFSWELYGMVWSIVFTPEAFALKHNVHVWQQCLIFYQRRLCWIWQRILWRLCAEIFLKQQVLRDKRIADKMKRQTGRFLPPHRRSSARTLRPAPASWPARGCSSPRPSSLSSPYMSWVILSSALVGF